MQVLDVRIKQTGPTPVLSKGLTSSLVESGLFASLGIDSDAIGDQLEGLTGSDLQLCTSFTLCFLPLVGAATRRSHPRACAFHTGSQCC